MITLLLGTLFQGAVLMSDSTVRVPLPQFRRAVAMLEACAYDDSLLANAKQRLDIQDSALAFLARAKREMDTAYDLQARALDTAKNALANQQQATKACLIAREEDAGRLWWERMRAGGIGALTAAVLIGLWSLR